MASNLLNTKTSSFTQARGSITNCITPRVNFMDSTANLRPFVICTFNNRGSNFTAIKNYTPYDVSISSSKAGVGIYDYTIRFMEPFADIHMYPLVTVMGPGSGGWNKRCISVENYGNTASSWRVRIIASDGGSGKRIECNFNVVIMGRQGKA